MRPFGPAYKKDVPLLERPFYMPALSVCYTRTDTLIKPIKFLHHFIDRHRNISPAPSRQVHTSAQNAQTELPVNMDILISQIFPQIFFLLQVLLCPGADQHDGGYCSDDVQVSQKILPQVLVTDPLSRYGINHETVH